MVKLNDVNTTDILDAIRLGCRPMCSCFNADDNDLPYGGARVRPEARLGPDSWEAHQPGRHLNALLNAEDAAGIEINEECIDKHTRAAFYSYGTGAPLPLHRVDDGAPPSALGQHDIREGFHALYALAKYRDSDRARELAESSIALIFKHWDPVSGWDQDGLARDHGIRYLELRSTFVQALARAIGPLVKYYRATGYGPALDLAILLKDKAVDGYFTEDGRYDVTVQGTHNHSITSAMSSLAQLADATRDSELLDRVKAFYDNGLWRIRDEFGWSPEGSRNPERGESNNSGDILETALILGQWGHTEYYHDAERILRCHILPSQLRDISFIEEPPNPEGADYKRNVASRLQGGWGIPAAYGHEPVNPGPIGFNLDIVGGVVGSLCEAYRDVTGSDERGHRVNLLFDHETADIKVESAYTHGVLRITLKRPGPLSVRVPPWVDAEAMRVSGTSEEPRPANGYLVLSRPPVGQPVSLEYPMAEEEIVLKHDTRQIRARLRGDEVVAMENFGTDLTYFDPID